jgi:hypothetical protein
MSKPAGKCVFCGETGVTKSHIWPDWLDAYLPPRAENYLQTVGEVNTFLPTMRRPAIERRVGRGDARAKKPRNVCRSCNGGWMSQIESNAKEALIPLLQGLPFDRRWIRETLEPPPMWKVWIARYVGDAPGAHWCRHYGLQLVSSPDELVPHHVCDTQATTYVMGQLCAHVFGSTTIPTFEGYTGQGLCCLWPLTGWDIDCRFLPAIKDKGVLSLSEALAREIPAIPE